MKRRSKPAVKRAKGGSRSASKVKTRPSPKDASHQSRSAASCETELAGITGELNAAREQHTAISEVLRVISQSNFDLPAILQSLAETAARLCRSDGAVIFQLENGVYRFAAGYSLSSKYLEIER
jgi:hypothetical protein